MFVAQSNFDALTAGLTFRARLSLRHQGQEALQILDVRQALESGLIGAAMDQMTPQQLAAVEEDWFAGWKRWQVQGSSSLKPTACEGRHQG